MTLQGGVSVRHVRFSPNADLIECIAALRWDSTIIYNKAQTGKAEADFWESDRRY